MAINRKTFLKEVKERHEHNLMCYSTSWSCESPKLDYEKEWQQEKDCIDIINEMLSEIPNKQGEYVISGKLRSIIEDNNSYVVIERKSSIQNIYLIDKAIEISELKPFINSTINLKVRDYTIIERV